MKVLTLFLALVVTFFSPCHALLGAVCYWKVGKGSSAAAELQTATCCFRDNFAIPGCCTTGVTKFTDEFSCSISGYHVKTKIQEIDVSHIKRKWTVWRDGHGKDSGSLNIKAFSHNSNNPSGYCAYKNGASKDDCEDNLKIGCQLLPMDKSWCNKANVWADANY